MAYEKTFRSGDGGREIVISHKRPAWILWGKLVRNVRQLLETSGNVVGEAYANAAAAALRRKEDLEDVRAERRAAHRARGRPLQPAPARLPDRQAR